MLNIQDYKKRMEAVITAVKDINDTINDREKKADKVQKIVDQFCSQLIDEHRFDECEKAKPYSRKAFEIGRQLHEVWKILHTIPRKSILITKIEHAERVNSYTPPRGAQPWEVKVSKKSHKEQEAMLLSQLDEYEKKVAKMYQMLEGTFINFDLIDPDAPKQIEEVKEQEFTQEEIDRQIAMAHTDPALWNREETEQKVEEIVEGPKVEKVTEKQETLEDKKAAFLARMARNKTLKVKKTPVNSKETAQEKKISFFSNMKTFLRNAVTTVKNVIVTIPKKVTNTSISLKEQFFAKMKTFLVPKVTQ